MSDLRSRQSGAPPLTPGAQLSVVLGALLIIGGIMHFKANMPISPEFSKITDSVVKSFH